MKKFISETFGLLIQDKLKENNLILKLETNDDIDIKFIAELKNTLKVFIDNVEIESLKNIANETSGKLRYIKSSLG